MTDVTVGRFGDGKTLTPQQVLVDALNRADKMRGVIVITAMPDGSLGCQWTGFTSPLETVGALRVAEQSVHRMMEQGQPRR